MSDPQIATAIQTTITSMATACTEMKKQAAGLFDGERKAGVMQGIDICINAITKLQADVDEAAQRIETFWFLTLPFVTMKEEDVDRTWLDPDTWFGDWQRWGNKDNVIVKAVTEQEARQYAAEHDCGIWLDAGYASCQPLSASVAGVIISTGGQSDSE